MKMPGLLGKIPDVKNRKHLLFSITLSSYYLKFVLDFFFHIGTGTLCSS